MSPFTKVDRRRAGSRSLCLLLFLYFASPVQAQGKLTAVVLPGESKQAAARLQAADRLAADGKWADALDEYQRLLEQAGDALVPEDAAEPRHFIQARWLCHQRLTALPPA